MRLRRLLDDDDAVSPVIGVILMVAITVILAAVIASFVLGLGPGDTQPSASFSFDEDNSNNQVTVTHDSGDSIPVSNLYIRGENLNNTGQWDDSGFVTAGAASGTQDGESAVTSGDSVTVGYTPDSYTVRVVWDNGDNSATLSES